MSKPVRILGIAGSLRRQSYNRALLRAATQVAPEGSSILQRGRRTVPPEKVTEQKRRIREADAVLFVTPEYNYSIPGGLKNAIDWASRPYGDSAWSGSLVLTGPEGDERNVKTPR